MSTNDYPIGTQTQPAEPIGPVEMHNLAIPLLGRTLTIERMTIPAGLVQWIAQMMLAKVAP